MIEYVFLATWWLMFGFLLFLEKYRKLILLLFGGLLLYLGYVNAVWYYTTWYSHGVMLQDTEIRVGPDGAYGSCGTLKKNEEILIYTIDHQWMHVGGNLSRGWVLADRVTVYE